MKRLLAGPIVLILILGTFLYATPAYAVGGTVCAKPSGKITITPGLTTVKKVQTIVINLPVKTCKGGGVTSGTNKGSIVTAPINVATFAAGKPVKLNSKITWNTKKTSTWNASATTKIVGTAITSTIKGKVTAGLFKGSAVTTVVGVKLGTPGAGGAIKTLIVTGKAPFAIK